MDFRLIRGVRLQSRSYFSVRASLFFALLCSLLLFRVPSPPPPFPLPHPITPPTYQPTHAYTHPPTCEMLINDPLEPASAMAFTALRSFRLTWAEVPDSSRAVLSTFWRQTRRRRTRYETTSRRTIRDNMPLHTAVAHWIRPRFMRRGKPPMYAGRDTVTRDAMPLHETSMAPRETSCRYKTRTGCRYTRQDKIALHAGPDTVPRDAMASDAAETTRRYIGQMCRYTRDENAVRRYKTPLHATTRTFQPLHEGNICYRSILGVF